METKIEVQISLLAMLLAIANIIFVLVNAPMTFLKPFSIALSVLIFYFGWKIISETETMKKIKMLFFLHHLEKEAMKKAKEIIKNAEQESKN